MRGPRANSAHVVRSFGMCFMVSLGSPYPSLLWEASGGQESNGRCLPKAKRNTHATFSNGIAPQSATTAPRARVHTPHAREGAQQLSRLNLRACPPHAAHYHEPRTGDSAHVQPRTSLFSPPASNACDPHARHDKRNAHVHAADAASRFQPIPRRHVSCRSLVRAAACTRRAQHQRARRAHALDAAPFIVRFNQRARAHFLLHECGGYDRIQWGCPTAAVATPSRGALSAVPFRCRHTHRQPAVPRYRGGNLFHFFFIVSFLYFGYNIVGLLLRCVGLTSTRPDHSCATAA